MTSDEVRGYVDGLTFLARQLNTFASGLKTVRAEQPKKKSTTSVREPAAGYSTTELEEISDSLFSEADLNSLNSLLPLTNY